MAAQTRTLLGDLAGWIRQTDQHAAHRLGIAEQAERVLSGEEPAGGQQRAALAVRLERWRYQHLNERAGILRPRGIELADALDLAANELFDHPPRPARNPRGAIGQPSVGQSQETRAARALDPTTSLRGLAGEAAKRTEEHFGPLATSNDPARPGRRMLMYAPLYLSNQCVNHCPYCGFSYALDVRRKHLTIEQAIAEAEILRGRGFRHVLLVAGDLPSLTTTGYFAQLIGRLRDRGIAPAIEIAPQSTKSYAELVRAGACGITLYQETYDEALYRVYHFRGPKASFDWRLEGVERAAEAGMPRLGLGILLGLADPAEDLRRLVRHAEYLIDRFPDRTLAFGLPRLHETPSSFQIPYTVTDDDLVRFYCALRVAFPRAELVLSTRETPALRARLAKICITEMSAGSSTAPGGYGEGAASGEQFPISDDRPPAEVAAWLRSNGFEPVWEVVGQKKGWTEKGGGQKKGTSLISSNRSTPNQ